MPKLTLTPEQDESFERIVTAISQRQQRHNHATLIQALWRRRQAIQQHRVTQLGNDALTDYHLLPYGNDPQPLHIPGAIKTDQRFALVATSNILPCLATPGDQLQLYNAIQKLRPYVTFYTDMGLHRLPSFYPENFYIAHGAESFASIRRNLRLDYINVDTFMRPKPQRNTRHADQDMAFFKRLHDGNRYGLFDTLFATKQLPRFVKQLLQLSDNDIPPIVERLLLRYYELQLTTKMTTDSRQQRQERQSTALILNLHSKLKAACATDNEIKLTDNETRQLAALSTPLRRILKGMKQRYPNHRLVPPKRCKAKQGAMQEGKPARWNR